MSKDVRRLLAQSRAKRAGAAGDTNTASSESKETTTAVDRITSPLARYDNTGRLFCRLCNILIKTSALWPAHLSGKQHKESLAWLKKQAAEEKKTDNSSKKRAASPPVDTSAKKRAINPSNASPDEKTRDELQNARNPGAMLPPSIPLKKKQPGTTTSSRPLSDDTSHESLPNDFFDDAPEAGTTDANDDSNLPPDFYDDADDAPVSLTSTPFVTESAIDKPLPSDFFDNPDTAPINLVAPDMVAAQTEAQMESEWAAFQKSITQADRQNDVITREEEDEVAREREDEEQIVDEDYRERLAKLKKNKQGVVQLQNATAKSSEERVSSQAKTEPVESESDSDDEDYEALMDWRTKSIV